MRQKTTIKTESWELLEDKEKNYYIKPDKKNKTLHMESLKSTVDFEKWKERVRTIDFKGCEAESIADESFSGFRNTEFDISKLRKVKEIGKNAFSFSAGKQNMDFSKNKSLKKIGDKAFFASESIEKLNLKNRAVQSIGRAAFAMNDWLYDVKISAPELEKIGDYCFIGDKSLKTADFSGCSKVEFGDRIFLGCTSMEKIVLPRGYLKNNDVDSVKKLFGEDAPENLKITEAKPTVKEFFKELGEKIKNVFEKKSEQTEKPHDKSKTETLKQQRESDSSELSASALYSQIYSAEEITEMLVNEMVRQLPPSRFYENKERVTDRDLSEDRKEIRKEGKIDKREENAITPDKT